MNYPVNFVVGSAHCSLALCLYCNVDPINRPMHYLFKLYKEERKMILKHENKNSYNDELQQTGTNVKGRRGGDLGS